VVEALERFFWRDRSDFPGPVNIGNDREVSVLDVAKYVQRRFRHSPIEFMPPTPQDPTNRRPDLTLANQVLPGWAAQVAYEDGVDRTIEWFRQRVAEARPSAQPAQN